MAEKKLSFVWERVMFRTVLLFLIFFFYYLIFNPAFASDEETVAVPGITVTESRLPVVPEEVRSQRFIQTQIADGKTWQSIAATIPGVQINPFGQLHVRGDHNTVSFALDGVLLPVVPEGELNALIDPRFLKAFSVQTGSFDSSASGQLGGVISMTPITASEPSQVYLEPSIGDHAQREITAYWTGKSTDDSWNYFAGADFNHTNLRLEAPQPNNQTLNNAGDDSDFFVHLSHTMKTDSISLSLGKQVTNLGIPNTPSAQRAGVLEAEQSINNFGVISWKHSWSTRAETQFGLAWLSSNQNVTNNGIFTSFVIASTPNANAAGLPANPADPGSPYLPTINRYNNQLLVSAVTTHDVTETNHIQWGGRLNFTRYGALFNITDAGGIGTLPSPKINVSAVHNGFTGQLFASDHLTWKDKLHVDFGLNAVQFNDGIHPSTNQINPLLNVAYSLSERRIVRFSYNHLFNTPPLEPDLNGRIGAPPEKANDYEVNYEQELSPSEKFRVGGYLKNFRNQLDGALILPMSNVPLFTPRSFDQSIDDGIEVGFDTNREAGFNEFLSYSYSFAESGSTFLDHDQRHTLSFGVSYRTLNGFYGSVDNYYGSGFPQVAAQIYNQDGIFPYGISGRVSRFITNLNIGWNPPSNGFGASLQIFNLFNCTRDINFISDFIGTRFVPERQLRFNARIIF